MTECRFWTPDLLAQVRAAESFETLADIASNVLQRMSPPVSQLCGPISTGGLGDIRQNGALFARGVETLRRHGYNPFDQTPLQASFEHLARAWRHLRPENGRSYCTPILEVVYRRVFESGRIKLAFFLPDWHTSFGATWERQTCAELGIQVGEFPRDWYENIRREIAKTVA